MIHRLKSIKPAKNLFLIAVFRNGIEKAYNVENLFNDFPQFRDLMTIPGLFEQVKVDAGGYGISWNDDLDLDAEDIWDNGVITGNKYPVSQSVALAEAIIEARGNADMTQKQLSAATGIAQSDISKIENGTANPSLSTINRIADGLGTKLKIIFE